MRKLFWLWPRIGKVKYPLDIYDGESTHSDGSPFIGAATFKNKKKLMMKIRELKAAGYVEGRP